MKHYRIQVYGRVIDVFFRRWAKKSADKLKLKGFVQNGAASVIMEVEGPEDKVKKFIELCHEGSEHAEVERVEAFPGELKNYETFEVK